MHLIAPANKAKCCSELSIICRGMLFLESVTINPPNWSFLGSFWPESGQVVKRGWLSRGPARFGSDLKTEEKLDPGQTGRRTAKAWPVDTSHTNPLAEAEADTLKALVLRMLSSISIPRLLQKC